MWYVAYVFASGTLDTEGTARLSADLRPSCLK